MSDLQEFLESKILRHPSTWIVGTLGAAYGGLEMYLIRETKRAEGQALQFPWLWLDRTVDVLFGGTIQLVYFFCAVWMIAGLMEESNVWIRQSTVIALFLGVNLLTQFL